MPIYEQTPIRLQVNLVGSPPVYPIDQNTGAAPRFFRASSVGIAIGIFDAAGNPVDLSNLAKLQLFLFKSATDLVPLVTKEITAEDLYPLITAEGWAAMTQQNGTFSLTPAETDQALGAQTSAGFWLVLNGVSEAGAQILYAAGPCTIYLASSALPASAMPTPSEEELDCSVGDVTVTPASNIHTAIINLSGAARTSNVIVGQAGLTKGARVDILVLAPAIASGVNLQFFVGSLAGANPFAWSSDGGTTRYLCRFYFDGALLQPLEQINPPF